MLELGQYEEDGHQRIGIRAAEVADELVFVGQRTKTSLNAALEVGFPAQKAIGLPRLPKANPILTQNP
jgi:UDP-N-acetylmuramoyl-tripeptide--D-alanyl-D-alanine ligase